MAISSSLEDPLISFLNKQRQLFQAQHSHLSRRDVDQLWQDKIVNAALPQNEQAYSATSDVVFVRSSPMLTSPVVASTRRRSLNAPVARPAVPGGISMSRKRSTNDRMVADAMSPNRLTQFQIDHNEPFNAYDLGSAPKMQKLPSGRKAIPRIQTEQLFSLQPAHYDDHAFNYTSPIPYNTSFSSAFDATSRSPATTTRLANRNSLPIVNMGRQESLSGSLYNRVASMQIAASPIERQSLQQRYSPFTDQADFDTEPFPSYDGIETSSAPIPIPQYRGGLPREGIYSGQNAGVAALQRRPQSSSKRDKLPSLINDERHSPSNRILAPRPAPGSELSPMSSSPESDEQTAKPVKILGADGKASEKYQISKVDRPRKQKERRFYCCQCNKHPSGFRGQHELQRHYDAQHAPIKKAWVCVDPTPGGEKLKNCKWCREQKVYPAYYNAAAHLRRIHFKSESDSEKGKKPRGGFSGGKYPSMDVLKSKWLKQVELKNGQIIAAADDDDDEEEVDLDLVDEEEINNEESCLSGFERTDMIALSDDFPQSQDSLTGQAVWKAEMTAPNLSTTVETAASSFSGSMATGLGMDCFDLEPMGASELLAATSANATIGGDDLQRSLCTVDTSSSLDRGLAMPLTEFEFSDVFPDLDTTMPMMHFESEC